MFQSSQVQSGADDIGRPFRKQDMPSIVALFHRLQDIRRIVGLEIVVTLDNAFLVTLWRAVHLLVWKFWGVRQRGPVAFMRANAAGAVALHIFLVGSPCGEGARGLEKSEDQWSQHRGWRRLVLKVIGTFRSITLPGTTCIYGPYKSPQSTFGNRTRGRVRVIVSAAVATFTRIS